ncbi:MAG: LysR family transcriptional regulator [Oscillospiraceae bacterium]|nr:LysR family transcriptional regulator [Oscillospiraceae bacterium]
MHINLDSYRVFYYVAQYRSFTKAAQMLYSNQPNVTRTIKNLEQTLGCTLFIRTSRSVQLTPEGEELFSHIAPAMQQIKAGEESVLLHSKLQGGTISIGVSEIALHQVLLPVLERFRQEYPGIRLRIFNSNSQQAVSALKNRLVDFALITPPIAESDVFLRTDVAAFQEVPVCGRAYEYLAEQPLTWEHLAFLPIISLCKGTSTHQLYTDWFRAHDLTFVPDIEAATADQILPMVRANLGIGFIPEQAAREAAADGSITVLQPQEKPPERTISLLKRKDMPLSVAAAELERMLFQHSAANTKDGGING